ncbi:hypothetical protein FQN57_006881 [Myotisia sp. PD_48]|nr:hypothetical protein FQN57_006881 [Myotisia sp. PD_48]
MEIIQIPQDQITSSNLKVLCMKFRDARLEALKADPTAFSMTYEQESAFSDADWAKRLQSPLAKTFVAILLDTPFGDAMDKLVSNEWVGMIVLLGPKVSVASTNIEYPWDLFSAGKDNTSILPDSPSAVRSAEATYFEVSMFVLSRARNRGIGWKLIETSVAEAEREGRALLASKLTVCLVADANNERAIRLYEKFGFRFVAAVQDLQYLTRTVPPIGMAQTKSLA